jgi:phosphatidylserine/phosphatidylglycerophosphate/cardiolipin synthase-like enzyme
MQYQYIELPREANEWSQAFLDLVDAVINRQKAGVDLRIIMSEFEKVGYLEQLHERGLDVTSGVRIQHNVHNKGILVDGKKVLVSSQNWSTDGTLYNRDAGVIIESEAVAGYFREIFLHDWENLTEQKAASD